MQDPQPGRGPRLRRLAERTVQTLARFPLALVSAVGAALVAHRLADLGFEPSRGAEAFYPVLMVVALGIPLFILIRLLAETRPFGARGELALSALGLLALFGYYMALPFPIKGTDVFRYFQLQAGLHLAVAFAPFPSRGEGENGFWQYNKTLLLRLALAAFYAAVLYVGLALALAACETLLDIDFDSEVYAQLWFWVAIVYTTGFFLAGVPKDVRALERVREYPSGLRIFTQYVLVPLVVVYLVILYAYAAKILLQWELPKGWVGYPVIGVSVTGMLALLLVAPLRERADNVSVAAYARYFPWTLFPLIVLIAVAIVTRIREYGLTENRYAVVVLTFWLLVVAVYFVARRGRDIRFIPTTLCLVVLVTAFGPWSASAVARRSQLDRLRSLLEAGDVMAAGVLTPDPKQVELETQVEISNVVSYLRDYHGLQAIRDWYADPETLPEDADARLAVEAMGLRYVPGTVGEGAAIEGRVPEVLATAGYDYVYRVNKWWRDRPSRFSVALDSLTRLRLDGTLLSVGPPGRPEDALTADLGPWLADLRERWRRGAPGEAEPLVFETTDSSYGLRMYLERARLAGGEGAPELERLVATFLVRVGPAGPESRGRPER